MADQNGGLSAGGVSGATYNTGGFKLPDGVFKINNNFYQSSQGPNPTLTPINPNEAAARFGSVTPIDQVKAQAPETSIDQLKQMGIAVPANLDTTNAPNTADYTKLLQDQAKQPAPTGVTTSQPSPNTVQAQPFTNPTGSESPLAGSTTAPTGSSNASPQEQAFTTAMGNGAPAVPSSKTQAADIINSYSSSGSTNPTADVVLASNQAHQKYLQDYAYSQSTLNQNQSLTQQYQQFVNQLGIPAINTQLVNMQKIIDGTEQDIRNEISSAGGIATDSQVLAMTDARNKVIIQNYKNLLQTRSDLMNNLSAMMDLAEKDRAYAQQQIDRQLNFDQQQIEYADKMLANAQDSFSRNAQLKGWDAIYDSAIASGDPQAIQRINSTMGPGFDLATMANIDRQNKAQKAQENALDLQEKQLGLQLKQQQINTEKAQQAKIYTDISKTQQSLGAGFAAPNSPQGQQQLAQSQTQIQQINDIINNKNLGSAVGPNRLSRYSPIAFYSGARTNVIGDIEQLRSQLNIQALIDAKAKGATFGALSDQELQTLSSAATKLGTYAIKDGNGKIIGYEASKKDFTDELNKISNFAKLDYVLRGGNPADIGVTVLPNGRHAVLNSDGKTVTYLD